MTEATYPSDQQESLPHTQSFNKRLEEFKKFATSSFTRARQYTVEKLGKADSVTELDTELEDLSRQLENIRLSTEKILVQVQSLVVPNPGHRIEDMVYSRMDRQKPDRPSPHELFGIELAKSGNAFGAETQYGEVGNEEGAYLLRCSEVEQKLGESQKRFQSKAMKEFITPLKAFLEIDVKGVIRERKTLNVKRLDLDASRAKAKKAQQDGGEKLQAAETEVRAAQAEYDTQLEKVRSSLKRIVHTHVNHLGHLKTFMAAQRAYNAECLAHLGNIEEDSIGISGGHRGAGGGVATEDTDRGTFEVNGVELDREESRKARVLYDYDAEDENELTIYADQIITVTPIPGDDDYMMAELEGQFGRIPSTYVELL